MRISKEPEVRKQELLDAAMNVFADKGYEAVTMKDIAQEANVVPGLCYHYFRNKQELYHAAVTRYARECSKAFIAVFRQTDMPWEECLECMGRICVSQQDEYRYRTFFDKEGNQLFHKELELYMTEEIFPYMERYLECLAERGEIRCFDTRLLARFLWAGQLAVVEDEGVPMEKRVGFIKEILTKIIKQERNL